jgi:hypothetical protein
VQHRNFRAPSPLLEVEDEDVMSPMFDSLDLDVKARQVTETSPPRLIPPHARFLARKVLRICPKHSHPAFFYQFVDIATGEKASKGFDHRASVSM